MTPDEPGMNSPSDTKIQGVLHREITSEVGAALILFGLLILLEQYFHTGWLTMAIPLIAGLLLLARGIFRKQTGFLIAGGVTSGVGAGIFLFFTPLLRMDFQNRLGAFLLLHAIGWALIFIISGWISDHSMKWTLIPGTASAALGVWILVKPFQPIDLVLTLPAVTGLVFVAIGLLSRKIGLIIPGSILLTTGPGVYYSWGRVGELNSLAQTGTMLVVFALGWGLITVFSRFIIYKFIWWPLIPGGVLAMVGWGLYIGGNPGNALSFIGNTGSIGLIIFGIYLLLWRTELRK